MASPYWVMMGMILLLTPLICWVFTLHRKELRTPLGKVGQMIHDQRYYLHIMGYVVIIVWKSLTDKLNEPIKAQTGHWTDLVHAIEGEPTLWVQQTFESAGLTAVLNFHYLFIYLFLIYVTTVYYAYTGERDLTDKVTLNYLLIYAIAVPYYLFLNVEVTSSWIPGMNALLYHDGLYSAFYVSHDPLDNSVPSLHVAIPFGILLLNWLHCREQGIRMREWAHYRYHMFILINTVLFCFTILYLGIHWIVDIPLGMLVGGIGAMFIHQVHPRLRNGHGGVFAGFTGRKWTRHIVVEGMVTVLLVLMLITAVNHQEERVDERVSFRLGPGDVTYEIIQPIDQGETVDVVVTNLDEHESLHLLLVISEDAVPAMANGTIDFDSLMDVNRARIIHEDQVYTGMGNYLSVAPNDTANLEVDQAKVWHLLVMRNPSNVSGDVLEVRVVNDYHQDVLGKAFMLSIPSLWITGFVVHRFWRLKQSGMPLTSSLPSHLWPENGNGGDAEE